MKKLIKKNKTRLFKPKLKVGEVWRFSNEDNPFKNKHCDQVVLEIKDGYVRYLNKCSSGLEWESSNTISWFEIGAYLVKDIEES